MDTYNKQYRIWLNAVNVRLELEGLNIDVMGEGINLVRMYYAGYTPTEAVNVALPKKWRKCANG